MELYLAYTTLPYGHHSSINSEGGKVVFETSAMLPKHQQTRSYTRKQLLLLTTLRLQNTSYSNDIFSSEKLVREDVAVYAVP